MLAPHPLLLPFFLTLTVLSTSHAALTNITIDDSDLTYFTWIEDTGSPQPNLPWAAITPTSPCTYCSAQPQTADIYNKTWHDGHNNSVGSFMFQGSAVYLYGIDLEDPVNISFIMDGNVSTFHYYNGSEQFVFKSLFFSAKDLVENDNHTVSWVLHATRANGTTQAALFDYAIITVDQSQTSASANGSPSFTSSSAGTATKSKSHTGAIAGGVVGGLGAMTVIVLAMMLFIRRRRQWAAGNVHPFPEAHGSAGEKTLDASWINTTSSRTADMGMGTRRPADLSSGPVTRSTDDISIHASATAPTDTAGESLTAAPTTSARERVLEERVAQLEAQVRQHLPPAYIPPS